LHPAAQVTTSDFGDEDDMVGIAQEAGQVALDLRWTRGVAKLGREADNPGASSSAARRVRITLYMPSTLKRLLNARIDLHHLSLATANVSFVCRSVIFSN